MAVVSVTGPTVKRPFKYDNNGFTTSLEFFVVTDDPDDGPVTVYNAVDPSTSKAIPAPGDEHPDSSDLFCLDIEGDAIQQKDKPDTENPGQYLPGGALWRIVANYSSVTDSASPGLSVIYPSKGAAFNGTGSFTEIGVDYDKNGDVIATFAGAPYNPALKKTVVSKHIEVEVNLASGTEPDFNAVEGKVNNATTYGGAIGTVMFGPANKSGPFYERGTEYYTWRLSYLYAPETWNVRHGKVLNQGLLEKKDGKVTPIQIKGADAQTPYWLKPDGSPILDGDTSLVTFSQYDLYDSATLPVF